MTPEASSNGPWENEPPSEEGPEGKAADNARRDLGLPTPRTYLDEALAPPVSRDLLQAYLQRRLTPEEDFQVADLIASFRSWDDAYTELLLEAMKERSNGSQGE